jgi:hypothetical protein
MSRSYEAVSLVLFATRERTRTHLVNEERLNRLDELDSDDERDGDDVLEEDEARSARTLYQRQSSSQTRERTHPKVTIAERMRLFDTSAPCSYKSAEVLLLPS